MKLFVVLVALLLCFPEGRAKAADLVQAETRWLNSSISVSGTYLMALLSAYSDWQEHVSKGRFKLADQIVDVTRGKKHTIEVVIYPRPEKYPKVGGGTATA